jgi:hypothetical protein
MKCKEEAYSPRRLTIRNMQCDAVPCHVMPHFLTRSQPILEQVRRWESKPEKNRKITQEQHTALARRNNAAFIHPIRAHPSIERQPNPNRPLPHARGREQKPILRKVAPVFKKAFRSFRSLVAKTINTSDLDYHVVPRDHGYCG